MTDETREHSDDQQQQQPMKRQARIEAAVDFMLAQTRRGYQSQVEALLSREQLIIVGGMKASGYKTDDIHASIIADFFDGDIENAPSPTALQRWVNRFSEVYKRLRAADHEKLLRTWQRKEEGADGIATEANYGLARMAEMVNATLLDVDDPRELTNGQLSNFSVILAQAAKAARDDRKLDKAIEFADQRMRLLETQISEREMKIEKMQHAAEFAVEAVERAQAKSTDGRVDASAIMKALRNQIIGVSEGNNEEVSAA